MPKAATQLRSCARTPSTHKLTHWASQSTGAVHMPENGDDDSGVNARRNQWEPKRVGLLC